jgi:hypothetical protein
MCCAQYHGGQHEPHAEQYPTDPRRNCQCAEGVQGVVCCGALTSAEDGLCDRCRRNCVKVSGSGVVGVGGNNAAPIAVTVDVTDSPDRPLLGADEDGRVWAYAHNYDA